jgi:hypothetical protein
MTASIKVLNLTQAGGINELLGVILEQTFVYFIANFVKGDQISLPNFKNPMFYINAVKFVGKLISLIYLYKNDYSEFKRKYLNNTYNISKLDKILR